MSMTSALTRKSSSRRDFSGTIFDEFWSLVCAGTLRIENVRPLRPLPVFDNLAKTQKPVLSFWYTLIASLFIVCDYIFYALTLKRITAFGILFVVYSTLFCPLLHPDKRSPSRHKTHCFQTPCVIYCLSVCLSVCVFAVCCQSTTFVFLFNRPLFWD